MAFSLGQAQLILSANAQPLIGETAAAYKNVQAQSKDAAKSVAASWEVATGAVRKATAIHVQEDAKRAASAKAAAAEIIKAERAAQKATEDAAKAAQQHAQSQANLGKVFQSFGGTAATLLGFGAIASGAIVAREAILGLVDATLKQEQAQKQLNAAFGASAGFFKTAADASAESFKRSTNEVEKGAATFGILQNQYALTSDQIKNLITISLQLNKVFGGDLVETFRIVSNAIQGEPQALERYGIALQANAIEISEHLTPAEQKRYNAMSAVEQAQLRMRIVTAELTKLIAAQGSSADTTSDKFNSLTAATEKFNVAFGKLFVHELGELAGGTASFISQLTKDMENYIKISDAFQEARRKNNIPDLGPIGNAITGIGLTLSGEAKRAFEEQERLAKEARDRKEARDAEAAAILDARNKEIQRIQAENTAIAQQAEILKREASRAAAARIKELDDQIKAAEAQKTAKLDALKATHDAELLALKEVEEARQRASELELARIQEEKNAKLKASHDAEDAELKALERQHEATQTAGAEQLRQYKIQEDAAKKNAEAKHKATVDQLDADKLSRDDARITEDRAFSDDVDKQKRKLEDKHRAAVRGLEDEEAKARKAVESRNHAVDDNIKKEDERHRKAIQNIEDEAKKQTDAIDAQIRGIDDAAKALDNARRRTELADKANQARLGLVRAQGTGTPQQVADARAKLTGAIRIGDPTAVKKAQDELLAIAGQGADAIEKAQKELSNNEQDLRDENVKESQDAEKQKLQDAKDAIKERVDAEKRLEDDRNRQRKESLDKDKQAEQDRTKDAVDKIDLRKRKLQDAYEADTRGLTDTVEKAKRLIEDRRHKEDEDYNAAIKAESARYQHEQDDIEATFNGEDHGLIPALHRALAEQAASYELSQEAVHKRYADEQADIANTYDNPTTGLIAVHRRAEEDSKNTYNRIVAQVTASYEAQKLVVERAYHDPDKHSGIVDHLEDLKDQTKTELDLVLQKFADWKDGLVGDQGINTLTWREAKRQADEYFDSLTRRGGMVVKPPVVAPPGAVSSGGYTTPSGDPIVVTGGSGTSSRGSGSTPPPPPTSPTGSVPPSSVAGDVDMDPGRYTKKLGFNVKYGGHHVAGAGWEADGNTAAWDYGPTRHKGQDLILPGGNNGYGQPVGAFYSGVVAATHNYTGNPNSDAGGNYVAIKGSDGNGHWYFHLKDYVVRAGQNVSRGTLLGHLGDTGTEDIAYPHLHYEVRASKNGDGGINNGAMSPYELDHSGINPNSYIAGRDAGYVFDNPTAYQDMRTGALGILAENGPERLLGRRATAAFNGLSRAPSMSMDYTGIGAGLAGMANTTNIEHSGDNLTYYGVAPDNLMQQIRDDQRRQRVLRGR